jgi:hypothetical protein
MKINQTIRIMLLTILFFIVVSGYEGDWSDNEDEVGLVSCSDSFNNHLRILTVPEFWLIMRVQPEKVLVYFQTRYFHADGGNFFFESMLFSDVKPVPACSARSS